MGGKSKAPPPPNYGPIAQASQESAQLSYQLGQEQLAWAREQYASDKTITLDFIRDAQRRQDELDRQGAADRARYEQIYQPLEDELVQEAKTYASEARQEQKAGQAQADVSAQFQMARTAAQDRLESFGIDPSQTRAGALDVSARVAEAAARVGAGNVAREQTQAIGRALRSEALNIGRGYPGQIATQYGAALQSGAAGVNAAIQQTQSGANTMGTPYQWQGLGNQALGVWGNTLTQGYNAQLDRWKANQQQSAGWGQALGGIAGLGASFLMSDVREKENIVRVGETDDGLNIYRFTYKDDPEHQQHIGVLAQEVEKTKPQAVATDAEGTKHVNIVRATQGSATRAINMADGGTVTRDLSPSGGGTPDDIPARLNANEFIVPADTLMWKGEEFFQKLIQKSREAKQAAPAQPRTGALPVERPVVNTAEQAVPSREQMQDNEPGAGHDWQRYDYNTPTIHPGGEMRLLGTGSYMPRVDPYSLPEGEERWVPRRNPGERA